MKTALIIILFVITAVVFISSCSKPMQAPVQQEYMQQMLGAHTWGGSENDSLYPVATPAAPGHDTTYTVALNTNISFVNSNTIFIGIDSGSTYDNFQEVSFYYLSTNTTTNTMLYYYINTGGGYTINDTLTYNYATNSMILVQHYENYAGIYTMNIHSP